MTTSSKTLYPLPQQQVRQSVRRVFVKDLVLAALIGIPYSYVSPLAYIRTNVEGTYNVLEAAKNLELGQV